jgi:hypothetical protein
MLAGFTATCMHISTIVMGGGSSKQKAQKQAGIVPAAGLDFVAAAEAAGDGGGDGGGEGGGDEGGAAPTAEAAFEQSGASLAAATPPVAAAEAAFEQPGGMSLAAATPPVAAAMKMSTDDVAAEERRENLRRTSVSFCVVQGSDEGATLGPVKLRFDAKVASVGSGVNNPFCIPGIEDEHGLISYRGDQLLYVNSSDARTLINGIAIEMDAGPVDFNDGSTLALGENTELLLTTYTEFFEPAAG